MSKYKYITEQNLKQAQGKKVREVNGSKKYTVQKVEKATVNLVNDFGFVQTFTKTVFKDSFILIEEVV